MSGMFSKIDPSPEAEGEKVKAAHHEVAILDVQGAKRAGASRGKSGWYGAGTGHQYVEVVSGSFKHRIYGDGRRVGGALNTPAWLFFRKEMQVLFQSCVYLLSPSGIGAPVCPRIGNSASDGLEHVSHTKSDTHSPNISTAVGVK